MKKYKCHVTCPECQEIGMDCIDEVEYFDTKEQAEEWGYEQCDNGVFKFEITETNPQ